MRRVIIESPYAGETHELAERNKFYLQACIRWCVLRGWTPYASHKMLPGALDDSNSKERALGIQAGFVWRRQAEATVCFHDLGFSFGMCSGITDAQLLIQGGAIHELEYYKLGGEWECGLSEVGWP